MGSVPKQGNLHKMRSTLFTGNGVTHHGYGRKRYTMIRVVTQIMIFTKVVASVDIWDLSLQNVPDHPDQCNTAGENLLWDIRWFYDLDASDSNLVGALFKKFKNYKSTDVEECAAEIIDEDIGDMPPETLSGFEQKLAEMLCLTHSQRAKSHERARKRTIRKQ